MKKTLLLVVLSIIIIALGRISNPQPAMAFDSDNYTSIDLIISGNTTMWQVVLNEAAEAQANIIVANQTEIATNIIALIFVLAFGAAAIFTNAQLLSFLAGFSFLIYGFNFWITSYYISVLLVLAGIYFFVKAKWA